MDHCTEQNLPVPSVPLVFSKFGSCIIGPDDGIPIYGASPNSKVSHGGITANLDEDQVVTSKLDYEVELGIVIGNTVPRFLHPHLMLRSILVGIPSSMMCPRVICS